MSKEVLFAAAFRILWLPPFPNKICDTNGSLSSQLSIACNNFLLFSEIRFTNY